MTPGYRRPPARPRPPFYRIRPLGLRQSLLALDVQGHAPDDEGDIREQFTLWDPQGQPHRAYPEIIIERAMTGRELLAMQEQLWAEHAQRVRRLFGASPLVGPQRRGIVQGLIAFNIPFFSELGRWTLLYREQARWYFSPQTLRQGSTWPVEAIRLRPEG